MNGLPSWFTPALIGFSMLCRCPQSRVVAAESVWKAGAASGVITPQGPVWMAGYATRTHPAERTLHELYVRVLALEDAVGKRAVIVSTDLLGIPRGIARTVCEKLHEKHGLARDHIMLNASHTHCGPVLRSALYDAYAIDDVQKERIEKYSARLENTIVDVVGQALAHLEPARLAVSQGTADFAVNRRNNREPDVPSLRAQDKLRGPTDHSVPVLAVRTAQGKLLAVAFGYACHNTTLAFYEWNGDYAGFAETNLERAHPGTTALFFMGCGGDQNPLPRRSVELCRQYGSRLSNAVEAVLARPMQTVEAKLATAFEEVTLDLGPPPTRAQLQPLAAGKENYIQRWAKRLMGEVDAGKKLPRSYPYPVQVWRLGEKQLWIALGGEVVVDYSLRFKDQFGPATWVTAYANDVMAYIPSQRVLREDMVRPGGYEGHTSMMVYGMPAERWADSIENRIAAAVDQLVQRTRSAQPL